MEITGRRTLYKIMEDLVNIAKASRLLGVTPKTLRNWEKAGRLHSVRTPGGHRRYKPSDLEAMLHENTGDIRDQEHAQW